MSLKSIIASVGAFFGKLFKDTGKAFNELPKEQQDAIIQGVNVAQVIKDNYTKGEQFLVGLVASKLAVSDDVARGVILGVGQSLGVDTGKIKDVMDKVADKVQEVITDDAWNALWENIAKFAARWLSTGKASWITLGLGVVEYVYQKFIKKVK